MFTTITRMSAIRGHLGSDYIGATWGVIWGYAGYIYSKGPRGDYIQVINGLGVLILETRSWSLGVSQHEPYTR